MVETIEGRMLVFSGMVWTVSETRRWCYSGQMGLASTERKAPVALPIPALGRHRRKPVLHTARLVRVLVTVAALITDLGLR